jgi:enoyl-CoA hydratase/carnithine racemase
VKTLIALASSISKTTSELPSCLFEREAYCQCIPTEDREEGLRAFTERRKPVWKTVV